MGNENALRHGAFSRDFLAEMAEASRLVLDARKQLDELDGLCKEAEEG